MLLIDAYNVLHAAPDLRDVLRGRGPRAACWALVDLLARWRAAQPRPPEVVLVFDGSAPLPRGPRVAGLQVRFTDSEADDDLKRLLERAGDHTLVSADGEIVAHAARLGQRSIAPVAFLAEVALDLEAHTDVTLRDPGRLSSAEVAEWLEAFAPTPAQEAQAAAPPADARTAPAPPAGESALPPDEVAAWLELFGGSDPR